MNRVKETCDGCVMLTNGACRSRYECDGKEKDFIPLFPDCIFDPKYVIPHSCEQKDEDLYDFDNIVRAISHVKATGKEAEVYDVVIITKEEYNRLKEAEKISKNSILK